MVVTRRTLNPSGTDHKTTHGVRYFQLGAGFDLVKVKAEILEMTEVILGRIEPPIDRGIMTLQEVAEAYYARAKEIEMHLLDLENEGAILRGSGPYKFRTGRLRSFIEMCDKAQATGSRRITYVELEARGLG